MNFTKDINSDKKRLLDNFLSLGVLQIANYLIPLMTLPYLSRVLGVEKFGLVFFAYAFCQYFNILTDFGFGLSAVKDISVHRDKPEKVSEIFSSVLIIKLCLLVVSFFVLTLLVFSVDKFKSDWLLYYFTFVMVIGHTFYPVWFFQGIERMKYITFLNITAKLIFLVLIFVFVKTSSDYLIVPVLNSSGFLVSGLIGFFIALKHFRVKFYFPDLKIIHKYFKHSSEFFLSRISVSLYTNTNAFFLGLISSNIMVGFYVAAEKIYQAINGIYYPVNGVLYPYVAKYKNINLYKKIFYLAIFINTFICAFLFIFAPKIITVFYGSEMLPASDVLRIFSLVIMFLTPSAMLGYPFLAALGRQQEANRSVIIGSVIHIAGLVTLFILKSLSIYTVALMVLVTEFIVFVIRLYSVKKYRLWHTDE